MRTKTGNGPAADLERFLEDLKVVVRDGQELLKSTATTVKEQAIARAESGRELVREHPYQALGVVFGLGVLFGIVVFGLWNRREDED